MEVMRRTLKCVFWTCLLIQFSTGCGFESEDTNVKPILKDEGRGRHRLQLLFPLLLRISTRLATLVPTALMALLGVIVFIVFSKKALIVSLLALFLTISGKYSAKSDDVYVHKVDSYPEYNDEEHIHYYHGPSKYKEVYYHPPRRSTPLHHIRPFVPSYRMVVEEEEKEDENAEEWYQRQLGHD